MLGVRGGGGMYSLNSDTGNGQNNTDFGRI